MSDTPFEKDGDKVRVVPAAGKVLLVLGWSANGEGKETVVDGPATFPAKHNLTAYEVITVARWPFGPCLPGFGDCPIPPDPDPLPIPPRPPIDPGQLEQLDIAIVRGAGVAERVAVTGKPGGPGKLPPGSGGKPRKPGSSHP